MSCAGGGVLHDSARGSGAFCEDRGLVYVRDVDGDRNAIGTTPAIISRYGYRVGRLGFIVLTLRWFVFAQMC